MKNCSDANRFGHTAGARVNGPLGFAGIAVLAVLQVDAFGDFAEYAGATTETKIAITVAAMAVPGRANGASPLEPRKLPNNGAAGVNKIAAIKAMPASKRTPRASYRNNREVNPTMPAANNGSAATSQAPR